MNDSYGREKKDRRVEHVYSNLETRALPYCQVAIVTALSHYQSSHLVVLEWNLAIEGGMILKRAIFEELEQKMINRKDVFSMSTPHAYS